MSARSTSYSPGRSPARSVSRSPARRLDDTDESQLERLYKPVFVQKPSSFRCCEGQTARFDLKVVGRPMPDTFWFHNGKWLLKFIAALCFFFLFVAFFYSNHYIY